jgi:dTDP-6-deoxy-L-talose 4-dehydrogenase (NAD+)
MKVAVTGATGFIGRHVLSQLVRHPVDVVALVRESLPGPSMLPEIDIVTIDLDRPPQNVFDAIGRPDVLIHLAWGGLPNYRSLHHFEHELPSHYRFLSGLVRSGLPGLVVAGTCFEYGMQSGRLSESMETYPINPYGFAKDTLRRQLEYLRKSQPFAFTWTRLFYLYGDGQAENSLLSQLKLAVKQGRRVFNMSGGEQLRDYLPVTEVADKFTTLALHKADIGVVNLCSGNPISVRKFVEASIAENGWQIDLNPGYYPYPDYEPFEFWGDREKLDNFLASVATLSRPATERR